MSIDKPNVAGRHTDQAIVPWASSLQFRMSLGVVLLFLLITGAMMAALWTQGRSLLVEESYKLHDETGKRIVADLRNRVLETESLAGSLANLGETLGTDVDAYQRVVPNILNYESMLNLVAGGGIWPEPFAFDKSVERRSFFWGRDKEGVLRYFDDYNAPDGPGYHHEEWYVPAKHVARGTRYWSRSYMDPYSYEPMVTCTVPMHRDGKLIGVSTVDLKLKGLREFFAERTQVSGGYAFALDHNNKFLSFPDDTLAKTFSLDAQGQQTEEYITLQELAEKDARFVPIVNTLGEMARREFEKVSRAHSDLSELVQHIDQDSYQINAEEATAIAAGLLRPDDDEHSQDKLVRFSLPDDLLLNAPVTVTVIHMPRTHWRVVTVIPTRSAIAPAIAITKDVSGALIVIILACGVLTMWIVRHGLIQPLKTMTGQLSQAVSDQEGLACRLDYNAPNELGLLAHWFNRRTVQLDSAVREIRRANDALEQRVCERTSEIQAVQDELIETNSMLQKTKNVAEAANLSKSEFLANMSHEIRTPMTAIIGYAEVVLENVTDPQNIDGLKTIVRNGQHLLDIINDILDLSKIESGKLEAEQIECSPCQLLTDVASLMRVPASGKGLSLEVAYEGAMPRRIQSDPTRLRQILINLIGNAIKFTEVGSVRVVARLLDADSPEPQMQFDIVDTGIGLTDEQMDRLFQPFVQADTTTTRKFGGTGLGLTISRRLAELLGGDVHVQSTEGHGSTFSVTVSTGPLEGVEMVASPTEAEASSERVEKTTAGDVRLDCRILLAEDGPDNQRLISFILKKAGAQVTVAENGQIAHDLALAARDDGSPFDVILMDMQMPVLDGYGATSKLREAGYRGAIIALTAHAMASDRAKCLDAGCDDYTTKPIDRRELVSLVARHAAGQTPVAVVGVTG